MYMYIYVYIYIYVYMTLYMSTPDPLLKQPLVIWAKGYL